MQEFIRRHFFLVHILGIAIASWLTAGIVTEVVATALLKAPARATAGVQKVATTRKIKPESRVALSATLLGHNIFDAEPRIVEEAAESASEVEPKSIDIDVDLLGTLVSPNPEWSLATIRFQNSSKLVRVGTLLLERVEIADIKPHYIVLAQGELRKVVRLWEKTSGKAGQPVAGRPVAPVVAAATGDQFSKGVKKTGPYDYQIDRTMLEENLQDLTKLGMQARIVPNYEDGKYQGFRLVGIRPDSLYKAIGLESGDLIRRVNGRDIDTPNRAIELFEQLRNSSTISLDIERRGQKVTMTYSIK